MNLHSFASGCWVMIDVNYLKNINLRFLDIREEDNYFGIVLFAKADKISILPKKLYNYTIRTHSTLNA